MAALLTKTVVRVGCMYLRACNGDSVQSEPMGHHRMVFFTTIVDPWCLAYKWPHHRNATLVQTRV